MQGTIHIKGAREHNLKNLELEIPREKLVVITGVSGSGKSSLAFDTIYAEGYRKYIDSLSTKARQVLEQISRPDVDYIQGLSPVIAIEQRTAGGSNPRSTVATVTEIADYARLLWSVKGESFCPKDGGRILRRSLDDCIHRIFQEPEGARMMILAPVLDAKPSLLREELPRLRQRGFSRIRIYDEIKELEYNDLVRPGKDPVKVDLVVDRVVLRPDQRSRIADSLELAFREGGDRAIILSQENRDAEWKEFSLSQHLSCEICGTVYPALTPKHFSWNHVDGACETCGGLGSVRDFVDELLVPDTKKSVKNGAIKPWRLGSKAMIIKRNAILKQLAEQMPFDPNAPWETLDPDVRRSILRGTGDRLFSFKLKPGNTKPELLPFAGVIADLEESFRTSSSDGLRAKLSLYQSSKTCPDCNGSRLNRQAVSVRLEGQTFPGFLESSIEEASEFIDANVLGKSEYKPVADAVSGLSQRLHFLRKVGLGYLGLSRLYNTLSGGEAQRVRLATQLGMGLVGVVYVLDEPSIGLHAVDNQRLIKTLLELRDRGNSVIVVEHDEETMLAADQLIEIGPSAGSSGGELIFQGTPHECMNTRRSRTGPFLSGVDRIAREAALRGGGGSQILIEGAAEHNLKDVDVGIPLGALTVVCGVSGSGKSTLINDVLGKTAAFKLNGARDLPGKNKGIFGLEQLLSVIRVDQSPIGRSPRSNPATFTKIFDTLRDFFSKTSLAKVRGYTASRFSFNIPGGRCERCKGDGAIKLDMQFLADAYVECPSCNGKRYNRETLEVMFKGYSIADVLDMTVSDALVLFEKVPKLRERLETLATVGLGYIKLGQPAPTLSGGEAQRIKLSLELSKRSQGKTLYILDEPTTGLHAADIQRLMDLLFRLRDQGNTVVVIEHNLDVINLADWIIEMGPTGGSGGGHLLFADERSAFSKADTPTGRSLKEHLAKFAK
ncbi:MAG: excinuclease ABC subunit UvrA [Opitutales bacterium]